METYERKRIKRKPKWFEWVTCKFTCQTAKRAIKMRSEPKKKKKKLEKTSF